MPRGRASPVWDDQELYGKLFDSILSTVLTSERNSMKNANILTEPGEGIMCNNICYCRMHGQDICHECHVGFGPRFWTELTFKLPKNGQPEYPVAVDKKDPESALLAKRWLDLQRATYVSPTIPVRSSHVRLPKLLDHVKHSTGGAQAKTLLGIFRQLLFMCTTQRYFFANQPSIMMQEFETFQQATLLTEAQLQINLDTNLSFNSDKISDMSSEFKKKARASLVSLFRSLLELNSGRTFWRMMELTTEAYINLLESYMEEADDHVLTGKAKSELLQWIDHVFWSLKHAQDVLSKLHKLQLAVYHN